MKHQKQGPAEAPFIHNYQSQRFITWSVVIVAGLASLWGAAAFGARAWILLGASLAGAVIPELVYDFAVRKRTLLDGSALVTGFLVALSMGTDASPFAAAFASAFGILVVKLAFGGLGSNWMNPAMAGTALVYFAWPAGVARFTLHPFFGPLDGVSAATPLMQARGDILAVAQRPFSYPQSAFDSQLTDFLNGVVFHPFGASLPPGYIDLAFGIRSGTLGEAGLFILILGAAVLLSLGVIRWHAPLAFFLVFLGLGWISGVSGAGQASSGGNTLFALLSGPTILTGFYLLGDPVTAPETRAGRFAFGALAGILCLLFRNSGKIHDASAFAVIISNCAVPALDNLFFRLSPARRTGRRNEDD